VAAGDTSGLPRYGFRRHPRLHPLWLPLMLCALLSAACAGRAGESGATGDEVQDRLVGAWRAEFTPADAHEPFVLRVQPRGDELAAVIERGGEELTVSAIVRRDLVVTIRLTRPEAEVFAKMAPNGGSMSGFWRQQVGGTLSELPFKAWRMATDAGS